jgi:hypothetical protein
VFIPFIDILYSLAIGTGFTYFPEFPLQNLPGTVFFIFTLLVAAQDWYEYHDKANIIPKKQELQYHIWQILVVLALNQMFRHSTAVSLQSWLVYFGIFAILNAFWNAFTRFSNHWLFVGTTSLLAIGNFTAGVYYQRIVALSSGIDGRWIILLCELLLIGFGLMVIRLFNR